MGKMASATPVMTRRLRAWQAAAIIAAFVGLLFGCFSWARYQHDSAYVMPPRQYFEQAKAIKPGMTVDEARAHLNGVSSEGQIQTDRYYFAMEPLRRPMFSIPLCINMYINLYLDSNGRVVKITTTDG
jgi:hypothetical protein